MAKKLIFLLFLLLAMPFLSSAPPVLQTSNFATGYVVEVPIVEYQKINTDFKYHAHVYNVSNGIPIGNTSTSCQIHIYNITGHIIEKTMDYDSNLMDWELLVKGGNFTSNGQYAGVIWCNSTVLGGYAEWSFYVNAQGADFTQAKSILYSSFIAVFILFFILIIYFIGKLPDEDRDEDGNLLSISKLKYLRSVLVFVEWMLIVTILFLTSNLAYAYLTEQMFAKTLFMLYRVCFIMTLPIVIIWFIWIFVQIFQDNKMKRLISKGIYKTKGGGF